MKEISIIIFGILSTIIIAGLFYFVFINRESEKAISLSLKILIPLIGAILWLLMDVFSTELSSEKKFKSFC